MTQAERDREAADNYSEFMGSHGHHFSGHFLAGIAHRDANPSDAVRGLVDACSAFLASRGPHTQYRHEIRAALNAYRKSLIRSEE